MQSKPVLFSGVQPSGVFTLGNFLGAMKQWQKLQHDYHAFFCVVDLHAMTARPTREMLNRSILDALALYLACGLQPDEGALFLQSQVPQHTELMWYLSCFCYFGPLQRMTQFKDKSQKQPENINVGLFTYPCLMAADILLYQTAVVPVGEDQTQHLELARELAQRVNHYCQVPLFKVPERISPPCGARIMSLTDPVQKMSKSDPDPNSRIEILDDLPTIHRKLRSATTDSEGMIRYDPVKQPGISNLIEILAAIQNCSVQTIERSCQEFGGYATFKETVATAICETLAPIQKQFHLIRRDTTYLEKTLQEGGRYARMMAEKTVNRVRETLGINFPRPGVLN